MRGLAALVLVLLATSAHADETVPSAEGVGAEETKLSPDGEFGPLLLIERIDITGNTATQDEIIRRALPIVPGDVLHASDPRLRNARFKVLALGFFRDVTLAMTKG